jgi:integrase
MTVTKRPESSFWQCAFEFKGRRIRESTGCTNKAEAQAWEVKRRAQVKEEHELGLRGIKRLTLYDVALKWLESSETTHRDHKNNESRVRKLFGSELALVAGEWVEKTNSRYGLSRELLVHELTQGHLQTLKTKRRAEGNSGATVNREMSLVQSLIGFAASLSIVTPNPPIIWSERRNKAASLKSSEGKGKLRWLRTHEEVALLSSLREEADRRQGDQASIDAYHLTLFLLDTGARYNEVAKVRWDQLNLDEGTLDLYRSKVENESVLRMPQRTLAMLKQRKNAMRGMGLSYVFPKLRGHCFDGADMPRGHATGSIQRHIDATCDLALGRATPHTFRDTFASRLVQAGVSLLKVSHLLGHADVSMTEKYAHLCPDATGAEAAAVLNALHRKEFPQGDDLIAPHSFDHSSAHHTQQLTLVTNNADAEKQNASQVKPERRLHDVGGPRQIRTVDQRIKSPLLYQLS